MRTYWLSLLLALTWLAPALAEHAAGPALAPSEILQRLVEGNKRFVEGKPRAPHCDPEYRHSLATGQHPVATILACSDSRVPPELVFDQGFGDLFVVRIAGNIVEQGVEASIEYGVMHAGTRLVFVVGHEHCGAVTAAVGHREEEPLEIQALLKAIIPVVPPAGSGTPDERIAAAVDANVLQSVREIRSIPGFRERIAKGELDVVGGVYDLDDFAVRVLETK